MSRTSDGGRYFSGTVDGYDGAPMIEVYAGQIMASVCSADVGASDLGMAERLSYLEEKASKLARVSVLLARALLAELGYPTQEVEKAEKARERAAIKNEVCRAQGLDQDRDGMDPHEIDL